MQQCLYQLELVLKQQSAPSDTAAILIEPVLGEGGYIPAPAAFLKGLREVCDKNNILLIIDEVQCGFGRTGTNFYIENSGVKPDIMVVAKVRTRPDLELETRLTRTPRRAWPMDSLSVLSSAALS